MSLNREFSNIPLWGGGFSPSIFPCLATPSIIYLHRVTTYIYRTKSILGCSEISSNAINQKLCTLASGRFFKTRQNSATSVTTTLKELFLSNILKSYSETSWAGSQYFTSLLKSLSPMLLLVSPSLECLMNSLLLLSQSPKVHFNSKQKYGQD